MPRDAATPTPEISVSVTFKNTDATDALKSYATEKITNCIRKFAHHSCEVGVVLRVEKNRQIAETSFNLGGNTFTASHESDDMYASIDGLIDTLTAQLRKHKDKLTSHH
ncbi:MAG: ribosome-associated translation inhibitor RaiA [Candidatus Dadabacteria bacterium]|nr:MAG: ribosome-associated translation inhibitor RaiA [Candidatus Dadabacteria bacterium]